MQKALLMALCGSVALAAADLRPLHYLSTDKPYYRPGETVYIRDVILDGITNCPLKESGNYGYDIRIIGPRGEELQRSGAMPQSSVSGMQWKVPQNAAGGVYTVRVENHRGEGAPAERRFEVLAYRVPRIKSQIEFLRRGYLPGEECSAVIDMERAEGGKVPESAVVSATAMLDGAVIFHSDALPVKDGQAQVSFKLPETVTEGDGVLAFSIQDGGVSEGASKTLPVLVDSYTVEFYPEAGDLLAGVPNRVYIEATRRDGKGADLRGKVVRSADGAAVAEFATELDGRGCVMVTPKAGEKLSLVITNATTGARREFPLPEAVQGTGFAALDERPPAPGEALHFKLLRSPGSAQVPAYAVMCKRDRELDRVTLKAGDTDFALKPGACEGVLTVTLYAENRPLAERLVFCRPQGELQVKVEAQDGLRSTPGGKIHLRISSQDAKGQPVGATVGLTVTDESVLKMADRREWAPRLREMVYLENEVRSFADADRYFGDAEKGWRYIDLLLGTQGWRRFVPQRRAEIERDFPDLLRRITAPPVQLRPPLRVFAKNRARLLGAAGPARLNGAVGEDVEEMEEPVMFAAAVPMAADAQMAADDGAVMRMEAAADMDVAENKVDAVAAAPAEPALEEPEPAMAPMPAPMPAKAKRRVLFDEDVVRPHPAGALQWIREYAHHARPERKPGDRVDFAETVYWNAGIDTDPKTGTAEVEFDLPDTVGGFAVMADGFAANGALGQGDAQIISAPAFYAEVKLPPFFTIGDEAQIPLALVNNSAEPLEGVNAVVECSETLTLVEEPALDASSPLKPGERRRVMVRVKAKAAGEASISFRAVAGAFADKVTRKASVVSPYFPEEFNAAGRIDGETPLALDIDLGKATVNGTQHAAVRVYLSPEANLEAALNALLRQPFGCFEQTSSTNYPLVMAQQYFLSHSGVDAAKVQRAQKLLDEGYRKLTDFECKNRGYEWFGADPGHEALTAYGLMEFADMAQVMTVDAAMMENTRKWLLGRRDGKGGFQRNEKALDSFGRAPKPTTDAYILWAMLESGEDAAKLQPEIDAVLKQSATSEDAYLTALAANIAFLAKRPDAASAAAGRLVKWQQADGTLAHEGETITCSGGVSRKLECAALAALAWVRLGETYLEATERTMNYLTACCKDGKFGSTQSTVLVLKAINAYDKAFARPLTAGSVQLLLDGKPWGEPLSFDAKSTGRLEFPDCGLRLTPGRHRLELRMTNGCKLSASIHVTSWTTLPAAAGALEFAVKTSSAEVAENAPLQLMVSLKNTAASSVSMPLAIVAIPGGAEVRTAQLRELVDAKRIAAYELRDNAVVLYWRGLEAGQQVTVPLALQAAVPGTWSSAASSAYLYYTDEEKQYLPGVSLKIIPVTD